MNTQHADPLTQTLDLDAFERAGQPTQGVPAVQNFAPPSIGQTEFVIAQRIPNPRRYSTIMERMRALANMAGDKYVYGWEVNDKKNNRKTWIEGPTIKLANDLWREFGNCVVDVRVRDEGAHWMFYARFIDLETGANMTRAYQQRKGQDTGMKDSQRSLDMVLQIGQSKAIRNVVCNALQTLTEFCVEEAKKSIITKIAAKPEDARNWILNELQRLQIERKRVEVIYGRSSTNWTVPDMAKIYTELRGVIDGMVNADDVWPLPDETEKPEPRKAKETKDEPKGDLDKQRDEAPPGPPQEEKPKPKAGPVTIHVYDEAGHSFGAITENGAPSMGQVFDISGAKVRVVEWQKHPQGYVAVVKPVVVAETTAEPQTQSEPPKETTGAPQAPAGDEPPKPRRRRGGGSLFGQE